MNNKNFKDKKVILSIDNLKKYFVNQGMINKAVDGVSFDVHEGEIVGLIGESGSGKTTVGSTILRLYDDYNGFVRLEDKIISGKRISESLNRFLRKNVQMIFQDPHASLNSQQDIYSILKEPLLVNGVMKDKIKDIFKDWLNVKKNFKYTFQIEAMRLELQNYLEINKLAEPLFKKWTENLNKLEFNFDISREDNFSLFFGYLEEKQNVESIIINNMYANVDRLIEFYYETQRKYRNKELPGPQIALNEKEEKLKYIQCLSKTSKIAYEASLELKEVKKQIFNLRHKIEKISSESKNTFANYIHESKNEKSLIDIARLMSCDLDFYSYNLKSELLMNKRGQVLAKIKPFNKFLGFNNIKKLINELDEYINEFYKTKLAPLPYSKTLKSDIKNVLEKDFDFKFDEYTKISELEKQKLDSELKQLLSREVEIKKVIKENPNPEITSEQLQEAKNDLELGKQAYLEGRSKYLISYKAELESLYKNLEEQKKFYLELRKQQDYCNNKYKELKQKFFEYVEQLRQKEKDKILLKIAELKQNQDKSSKDKKSLAKLQSKLKSIKVQYNTILKMYHSDISLKEDTLKSFDIERKYLDKDINNIYVLLGIDHKWVETNLKTADAMAGVDARHMKWVWRKRYFDSKVSYPIAKLLISSILYKTIIYKALEDVGLLKQFAYRYPHEFSGGQLQRIVIARALIVEPQVIVADEPIASLDISIQAQVVNLLKELCIKKNIGLIFIAHDLSMIEYVADEVQIMHLGKIVESGKTEAIYANPIHPYTINLFKAIPKISNANEKFQNVSFALDYLDEQKFPNVPETFKVGEDHYVYGTASQLKQWTHNAKLEKEHKEL